MPEDRARRAGGRHRIARLRFDLSGPEAEGLLRLRAMIAGGADGWLPAALQGALDAVDRPGAVLRLDRLEIDLGTLPADSRRAAERLAGALRRALVEALDDGGGRRADRHAKSGEAPPPMQAAVLAPASPMAQDAVVARAFAAFLADGRLPWWSPAADLSALEADVAALPEAGIDRLLAEAAGAIALGHGARRLAVQVEPRLRRRLSLRLLALDAASPHPPTRNGRAAAPAANRPAVPIEQALRTAAWALHAQVSQDKSVPGDASRSAGGNANVREAPAGEKAPPEPPVPAAARAGDAGATDANAAAPPIEAVWPVADAGLVILHPFLAAFFASRGLTGEACFVSPAASERAVHLTGRLAAGDAPRREPDLVIPKLLCGWPLAAPVARRPRLSAADQAEVDTLLAAVIGHWTALGRASAAALRESFLTRPGRLREGRRAWHLEVERRGTDVLLARLPWSINLVRLPWAPRPIQLDWA